MVIATYGTYIYQCWRHLIPQRTLSRWRYRGSTCTPYSASEIERMRTHDSPQGQNSDANEGRAMGNVNEKATACPISVSAGNSAESVELTADSSCAEATALRGSGDVIASAHEDVQALVERLRGMGMGFTVTGEGKAVTFPLNEPAPEVVILEGPDAWQYHDNAMYSDCVLEVEGLARMQACAAYLTLRSRFFAALFASPLHESTSRVVRLTPPDPSTFIWALHHLYTGALSPEHKTLLEAAIISGDTGTFWGLYQNASFLDCATLMDECMEVLRIWVAQADCPQLPSPSASWTAIFRHPAFQSSLLPPIALAKLVQPIKSTSVGLFVLLSWLSHQEGPPANALHAIPLELAAVIDTCASQAMTHGAAWLKNVHEAFPAVFHLVFTDKVWLAHFAQVEVNGNYPFCRRCGKQVPPNDRLEYTCATMQHPGRYRPYNYNYESGGWSCCGAIYKRTEGCTKMLTHHVFPRG